MTSSVPWSGSTTRRCLLLPPEREQAGKEIAIRSSTRVRVGDRIYRWRSFYRVRSSLLGFTIPSHIYTPLINFCHKIGISFFSCTDPTHFGRFFHWFPYPGFPLLLMRFFFWIHAASIVGVFAFLLVFFCFFSFILSFFRFTFILCFKKIVWISKFVHDFKNCSWISKKNHF